MRHLSILLLLFIIISCKQKETEVNCLGVVDIIVSGKESVQPHFEKGLLLLHSFEYEDAREAFQNAKTEDPEMAMAYWGEAMTYNHSLWQEQDYEAATIVLEQLEAIDSEHEITELEDELIEALLYTLPTKNSKKRTGYCLF